MSSLMNRPGHPEEDQADLVAEEGDATRILSRDRTKGVEMCGGGVVVDERVLDWSPLVLQGAEFLGVLEHESNVIDVGNREDSEANETKPVGLRSVRRAMRRGRRGRRARRRTRHDGLLGWDAGC